MNERIRLTIVVPAATRGGAELWQERLLDHTDAFEVDVVALAEGDAAAAWRRRGVHVSVIDTSRSPLSLGVAAAQLTRHLRHHGSDVVLGHGVKAGLVAAAAGRIAGVHSCWVRHDDSFSGRLTRILDALSDAQISTAAHLWHDRTVSRPVTLLPPIGTQPLDRASALAALHRTEHPTELSLMMATRLVPHKGVDDALTALTDASAGGWTLDVYGIVDHAHPGELQRLQRLSAALGLDDRVRFHEPRDDIGQLIGAFDAVAVLTRHDTDGPLSSESFSMVASEAMAAGTPVIAVPPVSDRVGAAGISVPPGNPHAIAAALDELADPIHRREHAEAGLLAAAEAPSPHDSAEQFTSFVYDLAHRPGGHLRGHAPMSVVTTVLNEAAGTDRLTRLLLPQLHAEDELIVVDGGSTDETDSVVKAAAQIDPRVRLVIDPGAGISRGRNVGIAEARHDVIACTDVGCDPSPGWLDAFRRAIAAHPEAGLWTGTYRAAAHNATQAAFAAVGYPDPRELDHPTLLSRAYTRAFGLRFDSTMPTGRSMAFSRDAWRTAGGFPEHLQTGEDVLFGQAVCQTHGSVLVRDAEVVWEQRPTVRATAKMYVNYGRGSGLSGNTRLLARDSIRLVGYAAGAVMLTRRSRVLRAAALGGAASYWSLPLARLRGTPTDRAAAAVQVPAVAAVRDLSKVVGAIDGIIERRRS